MKKEGLSVNRFLLLLATFLGIILALHTLLTKLFLEKLFLSFSDSSCGSGILLLAGMYVMTRFNLPLERQLGNFLYFRGKRHYQDLLNEAIRDGLTGLYNHKYFMLRLDEELQRSKRYSRSLSLLMVDIDYFKRYNDIHGHLAGDRVLADLGRTLRRFSRRVDIVARYGGEEFAMLLPETRKAGAGILAERLRIYVKERYARVGTVTVSIGVGSFEGANPDLSKEDFINLADTALYRAKAGGRNRVEG
ncbi:MAG: GGDEF domain-containing protein [Candidatus Omnitrophica bacterium]|nr:GGDEF domain-containing protein [Candidatus Omnitrophota bacterium]